MNHSGRASTGQSPTIGVSDTIKTGGTSALGQAAAVTPAATTMAGSGGATPTPQSGGQVPAAHAATANWGTAQMAAPPSGADANTQQIQQQYAATHGGSGSVDGGSAAPTASALPSQALNGSKTGTTTDVVKPKV